MINVLDIDVDLFVDPRTDSSSERVDGRVVNAESWRRHRLLNYMKSEIGLTGKLPGSACQTHEELLLHLRLLGQPVHLYHLDAHADLGIGQDCYTFYHDFLALPPQVRSREVARFQPRQGDFLLYAVACGYVGRLDYVTHPDVYERQPDIPIGMDEWAHEFDDGTLTLRRFFGSRFEYNGNQGDQEDDCSIPIRMHSRDEPAVPPSLDFLFVTRSPLFTPADADELFEALVDEFLSSSS